jgi:putative ABC transport system substrate-binding protein
VVLAARHAIPTVYFGREFVAAGGLMSYGGNQNEIVRVVGAHGSPKPDRRIRV